MERLDVELRAAERNLARQGDPREHFQRSEPSESSSGSEEVAS